MKYLRILSVVAVVMFAASIVRADDTRVNMNGGPGGSPPCGSNSASADDAGLLTADCLVTGVAVTTFQFEVLDANTIGGGLTCNSALSNIGWNVTPGAHNPGGTDICTAQAPGTVSPSTYMYLLTQTHPFDPYLGGPTPRTFHNDGDCDLDDFVLGIPVGCDIKIDNTTGGNSPFVAGSAVGFASNNAPLPGLPSLPEPGTLGLLLVGLSSLPLLRRKFAR